MACCLYKYVITSMQGLEQLDPVLVRKMEVIPGALGGRFGYRGFGGERVNGRSV